MTWSAEILSASVRSTLSLNAQITERSLRVARSGGQMSDALRLSLCPERCFDPAQQRPDVEWLGEYLSAAGGHRVLLNISRGIGTDSKDWCAR